MTTKKLLIETLNQMSPEDFAEFKSHIAVEKDLQLMSQSRLKTANTQDVVELMKETYRGECVEETRKALMKMNRTDLVQRLSDKQFPPLSQRVETMESLIELLLETLADLSYSELEKFMEILEREGGSLIPTSLLFMSDLQDVQDLVFFSVTTFGQQSVKKIVEVLQEMRRTDLAQRLTDSSSEAQNKHLYEHLSALIHKVATTAAVTDLLLETLEDLSDQDLKEFMLFLQFTRFQKSLPQIQLSDDRREMVNDMVDKCGHQSVEVIREVLTDMQRTDLVQRLSESSSGLKAAGSSAEGFDVEETEKEKHSEDERWPALIHKVEMMESVIELLLETLDGLNVLELRKFIWNLRAIHYDSVLSLTRYMWTDLQHTVFLVVQTYGQQSVEKTMEALKKMKRTDLAQRLSDCSSLPRKKHSVDERRSALIHKVATMAAVKHLLLETLNDLNSEELKKFKIKILSYISWRLSPSSTRADVVNLMMDKVGQQSVEVTREVFMRMNRTDLVQKLSETSSASREKHSVDEHGAALLKRDSSDWTKLEPEVNSTDADEAPTYSLQSAAGHFECRVSGLRWVCKGKTSFQYQFRSWEGHMERMESRQYMPAGPLMDVTVTAGKLNEVHLPHWICIDDIPDILDMFAVVHIDDCGDVVEKVSEVTPTHVKLTEPHFSIIGDIIRSIFPPKISCYMLMYYKLNTSFLKLHVYLIRQDPALEQKFDERKSCQGFQKIIKHHPDKYLQTEHPFSLRTDNASAKIQPKELTLRYNRQNFYEVYVKNPGSELILTLVHTHPADGEPADEPLWKCEIRADDHPESGQAEAAGSSVGAAAVSSLSAEENTVDKHLSAQMQEAFTVQSDRERLLGMLEHLEKEELEKFKWLLVELKPIPKSKLEEANICNLVDLMFGAYTQHTVEVTKKVFRKMNRNDLLQELSDTSS